MNINLHPTSRMKYCAKGHILVKAEKPLFNASKGTFSVRTNLAEEYIKREIIPAENRDDALHIACASIYEMDFLVSYNFEHIVKIKTIDGVTGVNLLLGYKTPRFVIPEEVLDV